MKRLKLLLFYVLLSVCSGAYAQVNDIRVMPGDKLPDLALANVVNYSTAIANLSDFKGKLLIFDYWFTGCGACISSWPKLLQLQNRFEDKVQIVLVNPIETKQIVEAFIERWNRKANIKFTLPSVTGDTVLSRLLPPFGYPTIVWIDSNGVYRATTAGIDLNEKNINSLLNNIDIGSKSLANSTNYLNPNAPMFMNGNGGTAKQLLWYSTFAKYSDEIIDGFFYISADSTGYSITTTNKSIEDLIQRAFGTGPHKNRALNDYVRLPLTRIMYNVKDSSRFLAFVNGIRQTKNLYTYQLISYAPKTFDQLKKAMQKDICSYFEVDMHWKKLRKKCLVLTAEDTTLISDFTSNYGRPIYTSNKSGERVLIDVTVDNFFGYLTEVKGYNQRGGPPLVDETGFKGGLDLVFDEANIEDYQALDRIFYKKYKMHFKLTEREVDILEISDSRIQ